MGVMYRGRGTLLGGWPMGQLREAVGSILKMICGVGEGRCAHKGEDQVRHLQHPMGLGDKFCTHDIINIYNIYKGQTFLFLFLFYFLYHFIDLEAGPMMVVWRSVHECPSPGMRKCVDW